MFRTCKKLFSNLAIARILIFSVLMGGAMTEASFAQSETDLRGDNRGTRIFGADWATRSPVLGANGMAATSHPLASQIAIDILKAGGTAVDAAIAANAAIGLMEPTGNGIGGDLFAIVWDPKTEKLYGLNASGRAPKGQTLDQLKAKIDARFETYSDEAKERNRTREDGKPHIPPYGSMPVTVPGTVDGWFTLHGKFGKMDMKEVLAPTIRYARDGHPLHQVVANYIRGAVRNFDRQHKWGVLEEVANFQSVYGTPDNYPAEGSLFKNPQLANTLEIIANKGRDAFYKGEIADTMDAYFRRIGGALRKSDFEAHSSTWVDPVSVNYRGYDVWELPPNGQGIAALQMLNILEAYDLKAMGHNSADYLHVMTEAKKLAFEDRARFYADPAFVDIPLDGLLSKDYAAKRRALIDMEKAAVDVNHGDPILKEGDTIYMTVADKDGMMVSLIQSNYRGMGTGLMADGLGFIFQDRGEQFNLDPAHPNVYAPGKRPFHTIIPAFMTKDGQPIMSFGLMGGAMQPQGHVQMVVNILDFGMNVQESGDVARYNHDGSSEPDGQVDVEWNKGGGVLQLETGMRPDVVEALKARGHRIRITKGPFGGYQAIWRDPATGIYHGASEMRKDGMAIGY